MAGKDSKVENKRNGMNGRTLQLIVYVVLGGVTVLSLGLAIGANRATGLAEDVEANCVELRQLDHELHTFQVDSAAFHAEVETKLEAIQGTVVEIKEAVDAIRDGQ
jgi:hypothetical protein